MSSNENVDILLIEDNPADRCLIVEVLRSCNLTKVKCLSTGTAAMDYLYNRNEYKNCKKPSLILLDFQLPMKSGLEVLEEIKTDNKLKCIPVIILTGAVDDYDKNESYECRANAYITKSLDFDQFRKDMCIFVNFWFNIVSLPKIDEDKPRMIK